MFTQLTVAHQYPALAQGFMGFVKPQGLRTYLGTPAKLQALAFQPFLFVAQGKKR